MTDDVAEEYRTSNFQYLSIVLAVALLVGGLLSHPPAELTRDGLVALAVMGFGLVLWQSKAIPHVATSLIVVGLIYALGIVQTFQEATVGFASTLFFFFFTILVLGHAISKVGLDAHVAERLLETSTTPKMSLRQLGKYVLALSFIMPSGLARMVAFTPIIDEVSGMYNLDRDSPFTTSSFLLLGQLNPIASMSLMTGGGISIIGSQLISTAGYPLDWVDWAVYMIPPTLLIFTLGFLAAEKLHTPSANVSQTTVSSSKSDADHEPLTRDQTMVAVVMGATLLAWFVGSFVGVPTIIPAIVAVAVLSAPHVRVLTAEDLTEVSWGILFLIGSMLSLIEALESTSAFDWLLGSISTVIPLDAFSLVLVVAILLGIAIGIRLLFPSGSICLIVVMPVIISLGQVHDLNVLYLSLSTVIVIGSTVLLPIHIPPALLAYNSGYVEIREVLVFGLFTIGSALVSICFAWLIYWPAAEAILY